MSAKLKEENISADMLYAFTKGDFTSQTAELTMTGVQNLQGSGRLVGACEQQKDEWGVRLPLLAVDRKVTLKQRGRTGHPSWETRITKKERKKDSQSPHMTELCSLSLTCVPPSPKEATSLGLPSFPEGSSSCQLSSITKDEPGKDSAVC